MIFEAKCHLSFTQVQNQQFSSDQLITTQSRATHGELKQIVLFTGKGKSGLSIILGTDINFNSLWLVICYAYFIAFNA